MKINYIIFIIFLITSSIISQTIYYVDPQNGKDTNSGISKNTAIKTIKRANQILKPGDIAEFLGNFTITNDSEIINPINSGTKEKPITYRCAADANIVIKTKNGKGTPIILKKITSNDPYYNIDGARTERKYITISGFSFRTRLFANLLGAENIIIENCDFQNFANNSEYADNPGFKLGKGTKYCKLVNNVIIGATEVYNDVIEIRGDVSYCLIEGNVIKEGSHTSILINGDATINIPDGNFNNSPRFNIIKNNYFFSTYHHAINIQVGARNNLLDGNIFERSGTGYYDFSDGKHANGSDYGSAWYSGQPNGIYRFNIIMFSGAYDPNVQSVSANPAHAYNNTSTKGNLNIISNRTYHNVYFNNYGLAISAGAYVENQNKPQLRYGENKFINNIFYLNGSSENRDFTSNKKNVVIYYHKSGSFVSETNPDEWNDEWRNNLIEDDSKKIIFGSGLSEPLSVKEVNESGLKSLPSIKFYNNISANPSFASSRIVIHPENIYDSKQMFSLSNNSPCLDAGTFLTYTSSSGTNSNKVKVLDAKFFIDGWGIVNGDIIQIGNEIVQITKIDYSTNTLTINKNISWKNNIGVSFPYNGKAPDIGAVEYEGDKQASTDPYTPVINQQPINTNLVIGQKAVFKVDATCEDSIGYQWWKVPFISISESKILNNFKFSGATSNTLTINNISEDDTKSSYICEVYNKKNSNLWINSNPASIIIQNDNENVSGLKVYLEAVYTLNNNMLPSIYNSKNFPLKQPYNLSPWSIVDSSSITKSQNDYIDWLLIELRSNLQNTIYRKPAILRYDGMVLNVDGTAFSFNNILSGEYYLVIKHRNHLSIMSREKLNVTNSNQINYDFTTSLEKAFGNNSMVNLGNNKFGMYAGDSDANGIINTLDFGIVANNILFRGYAQGDLDMNGTINVLDYFLINKNILSKTNVTQN